MSAVRLSKLSINDFIEPGSLFADKYIVERELGRGGMGAVLLVRHPELGTQVALKVMLPEHAADERLVERFLREGKATARLTSEHVARVFDAGRHPAGFPFLVMEFLRGESLHEVLHRQGPFDVPRAIDLMLQACEGVAHAHAAGIVHRDLKPANLFLVARADGTSCLKVLDFGIAKEIGGAKPMTATAESFGSPEYMSPEQIRAARNVDPRSDVWSLGVVLFELLTSRVPFESPSVFEIASMILSEPATDLQQLRPDVPRGLADVVARCFEKDPARRPPDVSALAAALAPFGDPGATKQAAAIAALLGTSSGGLFVRPEAEGSPVDARPLGEATTLVSSPTPPRSVETTSRRNLGRAAIALLAVSVAAASLSAWAFRSSRESAQARPEPQTSAPTSATVPAPPPTSPTPTPESAPTFAASTLAAPTLAAPTRPPTAAPAIATAKRPKPADAPTAQPTASAAASATPTGGMTRHGE